MPRYEGIEMWLAEALNKKKKDVRTLLQETRSHSAADNKTITSLVEQWGIKDVKDVSDTWDFKHHPLGQKHKTVWVKRAFVCLPPNPKNEYVIRWCGEYSVVVKPTTISNVRNSAWHQAMRPVLLARKQLGELRFGWALWKARLFSGDSDAFRQLRDQDGAESDSRKKKAMEDLLSEKLTTEEILSVLKKKGFFPGLPYPYDPLPIEDERAGRRRAKGSRRSLKDVSIDRETVILNSAKAE